MKLFHKLLAVSTFVAIAVSCKPEPVINRVPGVGGDEGGTGKPSVTTQTLKVCSFNIRCFNNNDPYPWSVRKDPAMKFIKTEKPDFVGLQELRPTQAQDFGYLLSDEYVYYDVNRDTGQPIGNASSGEGVGILFRKDRFKLENKGFFWLADDPDKLPDKNADGTYSSWNSACRRVVVWVKVKDLEHDGQTAYFFATHFDHKSSAAREKSSALTLKKIKEITGLNDLPQSAGPVFLVADFNCSYGSSELAPLRAAMKEARSSSAKTESGRTYNGFGETSTSVIDHIFFTGKLTADRYHIVTEDYGVKYISDHYPVTFECTYK